MEVKTQDFFNYGAQRMCPFPPPEHTKHLASVFGDPQPLPHQHEILMLQVKKKRVFHKFIC